jgi:hypothetical protein
VGFLFHGFFERLDFFMGFIIKTRLILEHLVWLHRNLGKMEKKLQNLHAIQRTKFYT